MEAARAAEFLCGKVLELKPGENIVLYCDTGSDMRIVNATAAAAHNLGAHAVIVQWETQGDIDLPVPKPVEAAVLAADVVIEYSACGYVHSEMWRKARQAGVAMVCYVGMNIDMMVRTINPNNYFKIQEFGRAYSEATRKAKSGFKITSPAGTNLTMKVRPPTPPPATPMLPPAGAPRRRGGMLVGQGMIPAISQTVNGILVFDGAIWPPSEIGAIKKPIELKVKDGRVTEIVSDHHESKILKNWFAHFKDPRVYSINHISPGFHPGVKRITGDIVEDERVFGCVEFGIGDNAVPCHTDGIVIDPSIWVDDTLIEEEGVFVEPTLKKIAQELNMQIYVE